MRDEQETKENRKAKFTIAGGILALAILVILTVIGSMGRTKPALEEAAGKEPETRKNRIRKNKIRKNGRKLPIRMIKKILGNRRIRKRIPVWRRQKAGFHIPRMPADPNGGN